MLGCDNSPAPDADDIFQAAQKKALESAIPYLSGIITIEITIPACSEVGITNPPGIYPCDECCTSVYTVNTGSSPSIMLPTTYSTEVCDGVASSCEPVCQTARIPVGVLNENYIPVCGDNADYQLTGFVMGDLNHDINADFFANTRSGVDAGGNYHLTLTNLSTISGSSNTIQDANGFREAIEYIFANITNYMPSSYNYENIFLHLNTCWQRNDWQVIPCTNECCTLEFDVTYNMPPTYVCLTSVTPVTCDTPCFEVCEEVAKIKTPSPKKIFKSDSQNKLNENLEIYPNPSKGETQIIYNSNLNGELKVVISDLNGNEILNEVSSKENQEYKFNFNTAKYTNGMYIINIYINGVSVSNAKFIINN